MIVFNKDLATDKHLWVFNNNIIKFYDDSIEESMYADIVCDEFTIRLYPDPDGEFRFNFKEHLKAIATANNLNDVITFDVDETLDSHVYDDTDNIIFELDIELTIFRVDAEPLVTTKLYNFISGVEQLLDYQMQETHKLECTMLNRLSSRSQKDFYVRYWAGYPFDISVYSDATGDLNILNENNLLDIDLELGENTLVNRIAFSDAQTDATIEDHLPIELGINRLKITNSDDVFFNLRLNKTLSNCGFYIKFRNAQGGWSYWLFNKNKETNRSVSGNSQINNDFNNIEDTISPQLNTGVQKSKDTIKVYGRGLFKEDLRVLEYIIESPKIYLFTGEPYSINNTSVNNQWIEISLAIKKLNIEQLDLVKYNVSLDFNPPLRNVIGLL